MRQSRRHHSGYFNHKSSNVPKLYNPLQLRLCSTSKPYTCTLYPSICPVLITPCRFTSHHTHSKWAQSTFYTTHIWCVLWGHSQTSMCTLMMHTHCSIFKSRWILGWRELWYVKGWEYGNAVASYLDHFFHTWGLGEKRVLTTVWDKILCFRLAICTYMYYWLDIIDLLSLLQYLMWRVIVGLHEEITLSFLPVGHTKFAASA